VKLSMIAAIGACALAAMPAMADTILAFDDAYIAEEPLSTFYLPSSGVTITGTFNLYAIGGTGNGDPGVWELGGTAGSAFLGCNASNDCSPTFNFSSPIGGFSIDLGLPSGFAATFLVSGFRGATFVSSDAVAISGPGPEDGTWATAALAGTMDRVVITPTFTTGFFFGADNALLTPVPEPGSWVMLLAGLALISLQPWKRSILKMKR
jgi:hypothetical protein